MTALLTTKTDALRSLLPVAPADALRRLRGALPPETSGLFAEPVPDGGRGETVWQAPGARVVGYYDLDAATREQVGAALGPLVGGVRRRAEALERGIGGPADGATASLLRAALEIPGLDHVFLVDGRPVVTGWGHVPASRSGPLGVLQRFDDGAPLVLPAQRPWPVWAASLAALVALLVLTPLIGVAAAPWLGRLLPGLQLGSCRIEDTDEASFGALQTERQRGAELGNQLASLRGELGAKRAQCPLPPAVTVVQRRPEPPRRDPEPPPHDPPPQPPPQQQSDLPENRWQQKDLAMLEGCWNRATNMRLQEVRTGTIRRVTSWRMCFDRSGQGKSDVVLSDGTRCSIEQTAQFRPDGDLDIRDTADGRCSDHSFIYSKTDRCHRTDDAAASCVGKNRLGGDTQAEFRR